MNRISEDLARAIIQLERSRSDSPLGRTLRFIVSENKEQLIKEWQQDPTRQILFTNAYQFLHSLGELGDDTAKGDANMLLNHWLKGSFTIYDPKKEANRVPYDHNFDPGPLHWVNTYRQTVIESLGEDVFFITAGHGAGDPRVTVELKTSPNPRVCIGLDCLVGGSVYQGPQRINDHFLISAPCNATQAKVYFNSVDHQPLSSSAYAQGNLVNLEKSVDDFVQTIANYRALIESL